MAEFLITASPRQRWALSLLLFSPDLKFKGRKEEKRLYRARRDLGLLEPSQAFLTFNHNLAPGDIVSIGPGAQDTSTRHAFGVTDETRDFIVEIAEKVTVSAGDLLWLEPIFSDIEERTESPDAGQVPRYDAAADAERWKPLAEPPEVENGRPIEDE